MISVSTDYTEWRSRILQADRPFLQSRDQLGNKLRVSSSHSQPGNEIPCLKAKLG